MNPAVAAVQGQPMFVWLRNDFRPGQWEKDWLPLYATRDRFQPNIIDPDVKLSEGDAVLLGGFPTGEVLCDPIAHQTAKPTLFIGHVISDSVEAASSVVQVEVPPGEYRGCSGGPAAIVDSAGVIRVWGVFVASYTAREWWPPWRRRTFLCVVRLPKADVERIQDSALLNPLEAPRPDSDDATTIAPARPDRDANISQ